MVGQGWAPQAATAEHYLKTWGEIPSGILSTTVPGVISAYTMLSHYGTMSFTEVVESALGFARDGFPMNHLLRNTVATHLEAYRAFAAHAEIFLRDGEPYALGEPFRQTDTAASLQYMVDEEVKVWLWPRSTHPAHQ